ncbi:MAG: hypothetical protein FJ279_37005, partial [Planctomycetes bacterium]|nr:hypothetical protein [Planctomycetota bacterium]
MARAEAVKAARHSVDALTAGFESGKPPLADPVALAQLGGQLRDTFLAPLYTTTNPLTEHQGSLLFASSSPDFLNLPWELLPRPDGAFLVSDGRWSIRRATAKALPAATAPRVARPLRILFTACAPTQLAGLDYEKEEEAILRIADRLGDKVHLDIAEAGAFDELRD